MYVRIRPKARKQQTSYGMEYFVYPLVHLHGRHGRRATREQKDLEVHVADRQNTGDRENNSRPTYQL